MPQPPSPPPPPSSPDPAPDAAPFAPPILPLTHVPELPPPPEIPALLREPVRTPRTHNILGMGEKPRQRGVSDFGRAWGVAMDFVFTILGGLLIGYAIDSYFKTLPRWTLILMSLGFVYAVWRIVRRSLADEADAASKKASARAKPDTQRRE